MREDRPLDLNAAVSAVLCVCVCVCVCACVSETLCGRLLACPNNNNNA